MLSKEKACLKLLEAAVEYNFLFFCDKNSVLACYVDLMDNINVTNLKEAHVQITISAIRGGGLKNAAEKGLTGTDSTGKMIADFCNAMKDGISVPPSVSF